MVIMEAAKMQISVIKFRHLKPTYKKMLVSLHALHYTFLQALRWNIFALF